MGLRLTPRLGSLMNLRDERAKHAFESALLGIAKIEVEVSQWDLLGGAILRKSIDDGGTVDIAGKCKLGQR